MIDDEIESRLRNALRRHADEAPPGAALLGAVTAESTRRRRLNRVATLSAAAAVLVAIGAAVPFALRGTPASGPPVVAEHPSAASPSGPALVRSTAPTLVTFPYTPPSTAGYGAPLVMLTAGHPTLTQELPGSEHRSATLTAYEARPAAPTSKAVPAQTTVHGAAATAYDWRYSDDDPQIHLTDLQRTLVWQDSSGTWLTLTRGPAAGPVSELVAYAESLTARPVQVKAPFVLQLMPAGWSVDNVSPAAMTLCPPDVRPDPSFVDKIAVELDEGPGTQPQSSDSPGTTVAPVTVGGRQGWLTTSPEGAVLVVPVDGGHSLMLQVGPRASLPTDVLVALAASISVTSAAQVSHG
jgi:hypothetical protein